MVNITDKATKEIIRIGKARDPYEACGLLLAQPGTYEPLVVEVPNGSEEPETSYAFTTRQARAVIAQAMDEQERQFVEETIDGRTPSFDDVVVWHTHPALTPGPSSADLANRDPRIQYLVIFLPTGTAYRY